MSQAPVTELNNEMRLTAQVLLDLAKKHVAHRLDRVRLFASATRSALDVLPVADRAPGYVTRTWALPALTASNRKMLEDFEQKIERYVKSVASAKVRVILFACTTCLALDDLSPDERSRSLAEATQIIGTPP